MENFRHWVLLGCGGCVLYGLLENLLPKRGVYPVIKAVIVLYILLLLLSPAGSVGAWETDRSPAQMPADSSLPQEELQNVFWQRTALEVNQTLTAALAKNHLPVQVLEVMPLCENNALKELHITLFAVQPVDAQTVQAVCDSLLEVPAAYIWENA